MFLVFQTYSVNPIVVLHHCHASDALCSSERADANDGGRMDTSESKTQLAGCKRELEKDDSATDGMYFLLPCLLNRKHIPDEITGDMSLGNPLNWRTRDPRSWCFKWLKISLKNLGIDTLSIALTLFDELAPSFRLLTPPNYEL